MHIYKYLSLKTLVYTSALLTPILAPTLSIAAAEAGGVEAEEELPVKAQVEITEISTYRSEVKLKLLFNSKHSIFSSREKAESSKGIVSAVEEKWSGLLAARAGFQHSLGEMEQIAKELISSEELSNLNEQIFWQ